MTALEVLISSPTTSGLFLDFDGTLSEIVALPDDARPLPGVRDLLERLAQRLAVVAVVSGRSAEQLVRWLGPQVEIWGAYGTQIARGGRVSLSELAQPFAEMVGAVKRTARERFEADKPSGTVFEDKGVLFSFHFRAADDPVSAEKTLDRLTAELAAAHGLMRTRTRYSFELRPPQDFSKAAVVLERVRSASLSAAAFVGDDSVDLPGFDALDELAAEGVAVARVAVRWAEVPPELLARADLVVDGASGAVEALQALVSRLEE